MAEALCARMGCISVDKSRNVEMIPLGCLLRDRRSAGALSFHKSVSMRPPLPPLRISTFPVQATVKVNAVVAYPASMAWWKKGIQPNMREINSAQEFVEAVTNAGDKLVLVNFYSVGCRSCKALHPKICQIAADNPDIEVLKVNFYDNNALCRSLNVNILPFFHFYRGKEGRIDAFSCSLTKINKLRAAVAKYKGHVALPAPAPGPVVPVASRKDLLPMPTLALATAGSVS